ncbi:hypothetical protein AGMMS50267_07970 [Spirochaetia bacterium]|nr:hypothetical protein AGMMS50267_07970 [Spirochaetia bacterium]
MKKTIQFVSVVTALMAVLLIAGCSNVLQAPDYPAPPAGKGYVRVGVDSDLDSSNSRTLLPAAPVFTKYDLVFTKGEDTVTETVEAADLSSKAVALDAGTWTLRVDAFIGGVVAATGTASSDVVIATGQTTGASVTLAFVTPLEGNGTLDYAVINNSGITVNEAKITLTALSALPADVIPPGDIILNFFGSPLKAEGTPSIPSGYYLAAVILSGGGKQAVKADVIHIYNGQITDLKGWTFAAADFHTALDKVWLVHKDGPADWVFGADSETIVPDEYGNFVWEGSVVADTLFKFSHAATAGWDNKWWGDWFAPSNLTNDSPVSAGNNYDIIFVRDAQNASAKVWKFGSAGYYKITLNPYSMKLLVTAPVIVEHVTINGSESVAQGDNNIQYTATVTGKNSPAQGVTWELAGSYAAGTGISSDGKLSVDLTQTGTVTIKATSTVDTAISGTKDVAVLGAGSPIVYGIAVDAPLVGGRAEVARGTNLVFTAGVTVGNGAATTVTWTVKDKDNNVLTYTDSTTTGIMTSTTGTSPTATLHVAVGEASTELTVTAASSVTGFTSVTGSKTVHVKRYGDVYVIGDDFGTWPATPTATSGTKMTYAGANVYTWEGTTSLNLNKTFKFHDDTVNNSWNNGNWFNATGDKGTSSGTKDVLAESASGNNNAWTVSSAGKYTISLNTETLKVTFTQIPEVTAITVNGPAGIRFGGSAVFTAVSDATHGATGVTWSVTGTPGSASTTLVPDGTDPLKATLTIGADETAATLGVKATSTLDGFTGIYGEKTPVSVGLGNVYIIGTDFTGAWASADSGTVMVKGAGGLYTLTAVSMTSGSTFKFHDDTVEAGANKWNTGNWFNPSTTGGSNDPTGGTQPKTVVADTSSYAENWMASATGKYDITLNTAALTVTFTPIPEVTAITVNGDATVFKGGTATYTADVAATHGASQAVTWSLSGNSSGSTTVAAATGVLTVAADETGPLTITAASTLAGFTGVSGQKTVTVDTATEQDLANAAWASGNSYTLSANTAITGAGTFVVPGGKTLVIPAGLAITAGNLVLGEGTWTATRANTTLSVDTLKLGPWDPDPYFGNGDYTAGAVLAGGDAETNTYTASGGTVTLAQNGTGNHSLTITGSVPAAKLTLGATALLFVKAGEAVTIANSTLVTGPFLDIGPGTWKATNAGVDIYTNTIKLGSALNAKFGLDDGTAATVLAGPFEGGKNTSNTGYGATGGKVTLSQTGNDLVITGANNSAKLYLWSTAGIWVKAGLTIDTVTVSMADNDTSSWTSALYLADGSSGITLANANSKIILLTNGGGETIQTSWWGGGNAVTIGAGIAAVRVNGSDHRIISLTGTDGGTNTIEENVSSGAAWVAGGMNHDG